MKTKTLLFLFCFVSLNVMGQGTITRQSTRKTRPKQNKTEQPARQTPAKKRETNNQSQKSRPTTGTLNGHEWVDLGLSVKWATCNVGANSPSDYGGYYAWGELSTKSSYEWGNCFDCINGIWYQDSGWGIYKLSGQTRIIPSSGHDTARENWGSTWRMPTYDEYDELCKNSKWTWTEQNGHKGYIITGPNSNSIFLPAAGRRLGNDSQSAGERGFYWSSMLGGVVSNEACILLIIDGWYTTFNHLRGNGLSVRPVTE